MCHLTQLTSLLKAIVRAFLFSVFLKFSVALRRLLNHLTAGLRSALRLHHLHHLVLSVFLSIQCQPLQAWQDLILTLGILDNAPSPSASLKAGLLVLLVSM